MAVIKFNKLIILFPFLIILLFACANNNAENVTENNIIYFEDNETVKYEGDLENGIPNGKGTEYNPNGSVKFEGQFIDGEFYEGVAYRGGKVYFKGKFKNGQPQQENVRSQEELLQQATAEQKARESSTPVIGMTESEVILTGWGKPQKVNETKSAYNTTAQWVYSNYRYLYFENGILTTIQISK